MSAESSDTNCMNCGYESHCGEKLMKPFTGSDNSIRNLLPRGEIEVCHSCRCKRCTPPDWG